MGRQQAKRSFTPISTSFRDMLEMFQHREAAFAISFPAKAITKVDPYITALYQIVTVGQKTNSYKFALWRALAHLAPTRSMISKLDLSQLFLEYYWPLELQYHVRQGTDPDKDPIVMRRIRDWRSAAQSH